MATYVRKSLGQASPAAVTLTTAYTVPGATDATVSSIVVCNRNASSVTIRISHAIAAAADADKQYLVSDVTVLPNETKTFVLGITLAATDLIRVYASATLVAFNIYGQETA